MSDFTTQYGTNIAGTITAALIFGIAWCAKNKCKHSKCAVNSRCFKCSADDETTIRRLPVDVHRPPGSQRGVSSDSGTTFFFT